MLYVDDFSVWLSTGSNPADSNRFRSHTGIHITLFSYYDVVVIDDTCSFIIKTITRMATFIKAKVRNRKKTNIDKH